MSWKNLLSNDLAQRGQFNYSKDGLKGAKTIKNWDITRGFRPGVSADEGGFMSGPTPAVRQGLERTLKGIGNIASMRTPWGAAINMIGQDVFRKGVADGTLDAHRGRYKKLPHEAGYEPRTTATETVANALRGAIGLNPAVKEAQSIKDQGERNKFWKGYHSEWLGSEDDTKRRQFEDKRAVSNSIQHFLGENQQFDIGDVRNIPGAWGKLSEPREKIPRLKPGFFGGDMFGLPNYVTSDLLGKGFSAATPGEDPNNWFSNRYPDTARTFSTLAGLGEGEAGQHINTLNKLAAQYSGVKEKITNPIQTIQDAFRSGRIDGGSGEGDRRSVLQVDPNKMGGVGSNQYLQSGAAAQDEDRLIDFWKRQDQINASAAQRLKDIESDRSVYNNLLAKINKENESYKKEIARIQPIGQGYQDELARIQPIGQRYQDELSRIQPFGKQYSDELTRLQPYDKEYTTNLASLVKDRDELKGYQGQDLHPDDAKFISTKLPAYDKAIADLQTQYDSYKSDISSLKTDQKDYQNLLSNVETNISDYQSYLGDVKSGQKKYQDYLGGIQSGQKELGVYRDDVTKRQSDLDSYSQAFSAAKQASDQAARSYTVRSQQGIASGLRKGVAGIRAARGFRTIGRDRNKSAKRRFNRDFRLTSFGNTGQFPINL